MLNELKVDDMLDSGKVDSRYGLVLASARRARQINEYTATLGLNDSLGIPGPQVHTRSQHPISIAIEELRQNKLVVGFREESDEDPVAVETSEDAADAASNDEAGELAVEAAGEDATVESATGEGEDTGGTPETDDSAGAA